jgi:hypothetical protein
VRNFPAKTWFQANVDQKNSQTNLRNLFIYLFTTMNRASLWLISYLESLFCCSSQPT